MQLPLTAAEQLARLSREHGGGVQAHNLRTAAPQIVELTRDREHITCAVGCIVIVYSGRTPDAAYLERSARAVNAWGAKYRDGLGMMVLISADEPPPDEPTRRAIHSSYDVMQRSVRAAVHVVEGEGFMASAKRSVITVMNLANSFSFPIKVVSTVPDGAAKLAALLGESLMAGLDPESVAHAAIQIRSDARNQLHSGAPLRR
jgi:hypothetical protein